jgi:signal transduction histidine kinase
MTGNRSFFLISVFSIVFVLFLVEITLPLVFGSRVFVYPHWLVIQGFVFIIFILLFIFILKTALKFSKRGEDITPLVTKEKKLKPAAEKVSKPGQLIGTIVHEIRRPLSRLRLKLERLVKSEKLSNLPAEFEELEQTVAAVEKVYRREQFSARWISVPRLFGLVSSSGEENGNLIFMPESEWVYCDPRQIKMALINLIRNSRRAYDDKAGDIYIRFFPSGPEWCLSVRDNAGGMEKDVAATIAGEGRPFDFSGMGLGLILVKKICRNHRGRMLIESTPGEGTKVMITFPKPVKKEG